MENTNNVMNPELQAITEIVGMAQDPLNIVYVVLFGLIAMLENSKVDNKYIPWIIVAISTALGVGIYHEQSGYLYAGLIGAAIGMVINKSYGYVKAKVSK